MSSKNKSPSGYYEKIAGYASSNFSSPRALPSMLFYGQVPSRKKNPTCPGKIIQGNPVLFRAITPYVAVQHSRNGLTGEIFYNFIRAGATFMQHKSLLFRAIWCYLLLLPGWGHPAVCICSAVNVFIFKNQYICGLPG